MNITNTSGYTGYVNGITINGKMYNTPEIIGFFNMFGRENNAMVFTEIVNANQVKHLRYDGEATPIQRDYYRKMTQQEIEEWYENRLKIETQAVEEREYQQYLTLKEKYEKTDNKS